MLDDDVREFFGANQSAFGAGNLLDGHLPSPARIRQLVSNTMTVDHAVGLALGAPLYGEYLERFGRETAEACSAADLPEHLRTTYRDHLSRLREAEPAQLAELLVQASRDTNEAVNLFVPKQCNLSCRGCYAAAVPISKHPYEQDHVEAFHRGALDLVTQARATGLRTVYTSGDGEPTVYPRFFDLLEEFQAQGVQWLFFTAGLVFSSEANARLAWADARSHLQGSSLERVSARVERHIAAGHPTPTVQAYLEELRHYRSAAQVYHSLWSTSGASNTAYRRPAVGDFDYVREPVRDTEVELPSSVFALRDQVFTGEFRGRFGIEMPVSDVSIDEVPAMAAFVVDHALRSYFEPTILTGRNRLGDLMPAQPRRSAELSPILVRKSCGFRNVHQPTVKHHWAPDGRAGFYVSPGMGVDLGDLERMGVGSGLQVTGNTLFGAVHAPLMAYANYVHIEGCKCNDFAAALTDDRERVAAQWTAISAVADTRGLTVATCVDRIRDAALTGPR